MRRFILGALLPIAALATTGAGGHPPHSERREAAPKKNERSVAVSTCPPAPAPCGTSDGLGGGDSLRQYLMWKTYSEQQWYRGYLASIMHDHWLRVGRCEQPGSGYGGINWSAAGSTSDGYFEGGLGIHRDLYRSIAGHSALQDGPLEQMRVATVAYGIHGPGAWACK